MSLHYELKRKYREAAERAEQRKEDAEEKEKLPAEDAAEDGAPPAKERRRKIFFPMRLDEKTARRRAYVASERKSAALRVRESALFRPMKAIGAVTDGVPLAHTVLGNADFITTSVGRAYQVFDCEYINPVFFGPRLNEKIHALYAVGQVTLTALKKDIVAWYKLTELGRFRGHTSTPTVLCAVGTQFLLSASENEALVWRLTRIGIEPEDAASHKQSIVKPLGKLDLDADEFGECTTACSPPTYLHKLVLGGSKGGLELWNLRSCERVHTFKAHKAEGKPAGAVTCVREAPNVLDTIAVGFASGRICILNAREDKVLMEFDQAQGRVTAMAFRAGNNAPAHLVSGAPNGAFVVWDLNKRRAHHVREGVHRGPIVSLTFLYDRPVLITGGRDNAIRTWIFDTPDGLPRLLKERRGCPGPPRRMAFYGDDKDKELIVCGNADGGGFLTKINFNFLTRTKEFDKANIKKLPARFQTVPPIVDIATCYSRHWDWPAIVTAHENTDAAFVWSGLTTQLSPGCLQLPAEERCGGIPVTAVAVSHCGNYCVVGLENGGLHRFNLQSQLHRGPFPKRPEPMEGGGGSKAKGKGKKAVLPVVLAHSGRVSGILITITGKVVSMAAHPTDCKLKLWQLLTHEELGSVALDENSSGSPSCLIMRSLGALVAISQDDGNLLVVDLHGLNVVRSFACGVPATDAAFSSDGRWLAAALRDGGLRIFDLPAARCVDSFAFARPALSVCFAPSNAYLLTAHAKGNAIQTWANKFLFDPSLSAPLLSTEPAAPVFVDEPAGESDKEEEASDNEDEEVKAQKTKAESAGAGAAEAAQPLAPELLTLSDVPPQKWLATLHLDLVKERNKAAEPPKPLPNAPFFLPTAHDGVTPRFASPLGGADGEGLDDAEAAAGLSRILRGDRRPLEGTQFQVKLRKKDYDGALAFLKEQTASGVHLAIEELGSLAGGDAAELKSVLEFFVHHLQKGHYADELQAYLSLFLQAHGEELSEDPELRGLCAKLGEAQESLWSTLSAQCQKARCFLGILTQTQSQW